MPKNLIGFRVRTGKQAARLGANRRFEGLLTVPRPLGYSGTQFTAELRTAHKMMLEKNGADAVQEAKRLALEHIAKMENRHGVRL